jgi:hypothetical protein
MRVYISGIARRVVAIHGIVLCIAVVTGCGESRPPVAIASGRVVCEGQPVSGGSVTFIPFPIDGQAGDKPGKAAKGEVAEDGSFRLTTFDTFDGAVVGRHRVDYEAPEGDSEEEVETASDSEQEAAPSRRKKDARTIHHLEGELLVEVKANEANTFVIELTRGPGRSYEEAE